MCHDRRHYQLLVLLHKAHWCCHLLPRLALLLFRPLLLLLSLLPRPAALPLVYLLLPLPLLLLLCLFRIAPGSLQSPLVPVSTGHDTKEGSMSIIYQTNKFCVSLVTVTCKSSNLVKQQQ